MPIYEFRCEDCGWLSSIFVKSMSSEMEAACKHCGGRRLSRAVSRFAYHKS
jgi:putative FmdB family regulatory protein